MCLEPKVCRAFDSLPRTKVLRIQFQERSRLPKLARWQDVAYDPVRQMLDLAARAIGHTRSIAEPGERPWTCSSEETRAETSGRYRCDYERKNRLQKRIFQRNFKEVRVKGNAVRLTYKLPMTVRTPPSEGANPRTGEFFTLYQMVEPMGVEPTTSRVRSCHTFPGLPIPGRNIQRF
jgi:hypothetical protein